MVIGKVMKEKKRRNVGINQKGYERLSKRVGAKECSLQAILTSLHTKFQDYTMFKATPALVSTGLMALTAGA